MENKKIILFGLWVKYVLCEAIIGFGFVVLVLLILLELLYGQYVGACILTVSLILCVVANVTNKLWLFDWSSNFVFIAFPLYWIFGCLFN
jgi:hypothetical protein